MSNRLALGTAQFGLKYGIANASAQVTPAAIEAILRTANRAGIDTLDTAIGYGSSESCLGEADVSSWRIITKLPGLPHDTSNVPEWVHAQVLGSLDRLGIAQLDALLLHKPSDLLGPSGSQIRNALAALKFGGYVRATGVSIYDPAELEAIWPSWQPDIVQSPCNVLDRRLIRSGWLAKLIGHGVRVHVRSAFLQGLLLMTITQRPACFAPWAALLNSWLDWCSREGTSPLRAALAFVLAQSTIERVVIGVDSDSQLQEILDALSSKAPPAPEGLISEDLDLIEPWRWKLT